MDKKTNPEGITTINELAIMINNGFLNTQDYMDKKFEKIDEKFEKIDERFDKIDKRFDKIEKVTLKNQEERLEKVSSHAKEVKGLLFLAK